MKKDILFLCQFFYPEHNTSATLPFDTAKHLAANGFSVDALVGYPKEYNDIDNVPAKQIIDGVRIHRIRYIQLKRDRRLSRLINYFSFTLSAAFRLFKLRRYKSVIVYSNPPVLPFVAVLANLLYGTKIVFVAYDVYPEVAYTSGSVVRGSIIDKGMRWINRKMYKRVSKVVSLTDEMRAFLLERRPELSEDRVTTIANWAHEKKVVADHDAYERFGYKDGQFVVSYFGNMGICQDMGTLIGAIRKLKVDDRVRFLIVGHGSKKEYVRNSVSDISNVQVVDFLTGKDFEQAVAISSVAVVSLEKGLHGTCAPSKFYSYLQGGQPILAVVEKDSYLAEEVEQEKIGRAVEIGDVDGLVRAIQSMVEDREGCAEMGRRAEKLYEEKYALDIGLEKYRQVMEEVIR